MQQWVAEQHVDLSRLSTNDLHSGLLLLRYLRANQFDTAKTKDQILSNIEWRDNMSVTTVSRQLPEDILGFSVEQLAACLPHWQTGYDKTGRPVLYKQYTKFDATALKGLCGGDFDRVMQYHIWEQEACGRLCAAESRRQQRTIETITAVIDVKDMRMRQVTGDFIQLVKLVAEVDGKQYPETMGRTFIINAPSYFSLAWRLVRGFIDPNTVAKINIFGGPKDFEPVLLDCIGADNLPSTYGGNLPPLSAEMHPYAEAMRSYPMPPLELTQVGYTYREARASTAANPLRSIDSFPYPDTTPGADPVHGVYWGGLSSTSQRALDDMQQWVAEQHVDLSRLSTNDLHSGLLLLRYLRANQFDTAKTKDQILSNIEWRDNMSVTTVSRQLPEDILGFSVEQLAACLPHWQTGYDKTGRPVLYKQYTKFDATALKGLCGGDFDRVMQYHIWEQEACGRLCAAESRRQQRTIETITAVIDVKDMRMRQVTGDFIQLVKLVAEVDGKQYPETMGRTFIINAPSYFSLAWRLVRGFIDPNTVAKINIFGGPKDFEPVLLDCIGADNLPSTYGGNLPPLSAEMHPYAEAMRSYPMPLNRSSTAQQVVAEKRPPLTRPSSLRKAASFVLGKRASEDNGIWGYASHLAENVQAWWGGAEDESSSDEEELKSIDSEDPNFRDAFESTTDLESKTHSYVYSMSNRGSDDLEAGGSGRSTVRREKRKRLRVSKWVVMRPIVRCLRRAVCDRMFDRWTPDELQSVVIKGVALHLMCSIAAVGISSAALQEVSWSSKGARLELWTYTVVVLLSCVMIVFDCIGWYASYTRNWCLLVMHQAGLTVSTLVCATVTVASFVYYYIPQINTNSAMDSSGIAKSSNTSKRFLLILGIGCLIVTVCGALPLILNRALIRKLCRLQGKRPQVKDLQVTLKIAQSISTCVALVMVCYGGLGVEYLLGIRFVDALFPVYGLIYGGVAVLISSSFGIWVSNTVHKSVLRLYRYFVLPFIVFVLLIVSVTAFEGMYSVNYHSNFNSHSTNNEQATEERVNTNVQTFLLITGILTVFVCLFQAISLAATMALSQVIASSSQVKEKLKILQVMREKELGIYPAGYSVTSGDTGDNFWANFSVDDLGRLYLLYSRDREDRLLVAWGIFMGLINIFVTGTFAMFANYVDVASMRNEWVFGLIIMLGRADERFVNKDGYLQTSLAFLALVVGPLLLIYAWSTFVCAPYRHVLGMMVSSSQMIVWLLFLFIEVFSGMQDWHRDAPMELVFMSTVGFLMYFVVPLWVLRKEAGASTNDTSQNDSQQMLMEMDKANSGSLFGSYTYGVEGQDDGGEKGHTSLSRRRFPTHMSHHQKAGQIAKVESQSSFDQIMGNIREDDEASHASSTRSFLLRLGSDDGGSSHSLGHMRSLALSVLNDQRAHFQLDCPPPSPFSARAILQHADAGEAEEKDDEFLPISRPEGRITPSTPLRNTPSPRAPSPGVAFDQEGIGIERGSPEGVGDNQEQDVRASPKKVSGKMGMTSAFLRRRSAVKNRASSAKASVSSVIRAAAATSNFEPQTVLPVLIKMGLSSTDAAGMITYLMRLKDVERAPGKRKKSIAMVV